MYILAAVEDSATKMLAANWMAQCKFGSGSFASGLAKGDDRSTSASPPIVLQNPIGFCGWGVFEHYSACSVLREFDGVIVTHAWQTGLGRAGNFGEWRWAAEELDKAP